MSVGRRRSRRGHGDTRRASASTGAATPRAETSGGKSDVERSRRHRGLERFCHAVPVASLRTPRMYRRQASRSDRRSRVRPARRRRAAADDRARSRCSRRSRSPACRGESQVVVLGRQRRQAADKPEPIHPRPARTRRRSATVPAAGRHRGRLLHRGHALHGGQGRIETGFQVRRIDVADHAQHVGRMFVTGAWFCSASVIPASPAQRAASIRPRGTSPRSARARLEVRSRQTCRAFVSARPPGSSSRPARPRTRAAASRRDRRSSE